jgi:hypothetical protein
MSMDQLLTNREYELAELHTKLRRAKNALERFNPRRIGYGQSLSHDALGDAWRNAESVIKDLKTP